jgi:iron complex outermembrane receptor protein
MRKSSANFPVSQRSRIAFRLAGRRPVLTALCAASASIFYPAAASAQETRLEEVVVSASRGEQSRFDAPAAIDAVTVDPMRLATPLVNLSELLSAVPGVQVRERQNYAQDLQISARGFGTRSTFGVRGVRILIDGIPATMPDGQGQAATASLASARSVELLRGPLAQLYGNAAGGVLQVFTRQPPVTPGRPEVGLNVGAGSDNQRQFGASLAGGNETVGALVDFSHYRTDGYRDHSAAERNQVNAKLVAKPGADTTITAIFNSFDQPLSEDPLGLTRSAFEQNERAVIANALAFNTRKTISQQQAGLVLEQRLSASDILGARLYTGQREVNQKLAFQANGVVDLDRTYGGVGLNWNHRTTLAGLPLRWTVGVEADRLKERRKGFDNLAGTEGTLRRNEDDSARNSDVYAQAALTLAPAWDLTAGVRHSRVRFSVDDQFNPAASSTSGSVQYRNTSPVLGLVWHATDAVNVYGNIGTGFETPTLAESAYRPGGLPGPNFALKPSKSTQGEIGVKIRSGSHSLDAAVFDAESRNEIVSQSSGGRATFQNAGRAQRRGAELSWNTDWTGWKTRLAYTLLDARFKSGYASNTAVIPSGNRLPGAPRNSLFADVEKRLGEALSVGLEMRADTKVYVNDANSEAAPGYAVFNARAGYEFRLAGARMFFYARVDNLFDRMYAGSVIVNDANGRFYEAAAGRRVFAGLRTVF